MRHLFITPVVVLLCSAASSLHAQNGPTGEPVVEPAPIDPAPVDNGRKVVVDDDAGAPGQGPKKELRENTSKGTVDVSVEFESEGSSTTRNDGVFVFIEDSGGNIVESKFVSKDDGFNATLNPGETMYAADVNDPGTNTDPDTWTRDGNNNDVKLCISESDA